MGLIRGLRAQLLSLLPFGLQKRLLDALGWVVQRVVREPVIDYRGQRIYLLPDDPSTARILVSYLYWRDWHHEAGTQASVERLIAARGQRVFFIDGGASFGMYSFLAATQAAVEKVIAVEASSASFAKLERSVAESTCATRIECRFGALTDSSARRLAIAPAIGSSEWQQVQDADSDTACRHSPSTSWSRAWRCAPKTPCSSSWISKAVKSMQWLAWVPLLRPITTCW